MLSFFFFFPRKSLRFYRGNAYPDYELELSEIVAKRDEKLKSSKQSHVLRSQLRRLASAPVLKAFVSTGVPYAMQQFSGVPILIIYMTNIFKAIRQRKPNAIELRNLLFSLLIRIPAPRSTRSCLPFLWG